MQQGKGQQPPAQPPQSPTGGTPSTIPPTCSITSSTVSSNASSTTATLSWSTYGDATSANISPNLGSVPISGSQTVTVTATTPYSMTVSGSGGTNFCSATVIGLGGGGGCDGLYASLYGCDDDGDGDGDGDGEGDGENIVDLVVSPNSGTAPLRVTIGGPSGILSKINQCEYSVGFQGSSGNGLFIEWGDGVTSPEATDDNLGESCVEEVKTHTYTQPGTYQIKATSWHPGPTDKPITDLKAVATIIVTAPSNTSTTTSTTSTTTSSTQTPVFQNAAFLLPGLRGDIQIIGTGGTVIAGARDQSKNTEVTGFYGGNTFSGQPQGIVASLCRSRPWAGSFLSAVLPAAFFDGLCTSRGYAVGVPPAAHVPTRVTVTQTAPRPVQRATSTAATSTAPAVPPKVRVWAVPAKVPIGTRTSVFWTSQGVTSCMVTSPDGSFSQTTLQGGASTVPLTGATTYTISCLTSDGTPVTDFVTVQMAI